MLNAKDGARKAVALHGLYKMLISRKLDSIVSQLPSEITGVQQVCLCMRACVWACVGMGSWVHVRVQASMHVCAHA